MSIEFDAACEALWQHATQDIPIHTIDSGRQRQGNYVDGFRKDIDVWTRDEPPQTIRATKINWQTFNLAADCEGTRQILEIVQGETVIFQATREGASTTTRFEGPEERYLDRKETVAQSWQIVTGPLPDRNKMAKTA